MIKSLRKAFGLVCMALLCTLAACTSDIDTSSIETQPGGQTGTNTGTTATVKLPVSASTKTIGIPSTSDLSAMNAFTVILGGKSQTVKVSELDSSGTITFTDLQVGDTTLTVYAYSSESVIDDSTLVEYGTQTVTIYAGSDNLLESQLSLIYNDLENHTNLKGNISIGLDWSLTNSNEVKTIALIEDTTNQTVASQQVSDGMQTTFQASVPVTKGTFMHFRFLDGSGKELGLSESTLVKIASGQTSQFYDITDNRTVKDLRLPANSFAPAYKVVSADLAYTEKEDELKLNWQMPAAYSGLKISFYKVGDIANVTTLNWNTTDNADAIKNGTYTFSGLEAGKQYVASLVAVHNQDGIDFDSAALTVTKIAAIKLTNLAIKEYTGTFGVGDVIQLEKVITPENATDLGYTWTSSNEDVIAITNDSTGLVTVKGYGSTTITLTSINQKKTATYDVVVTLPSVNNIKAMAELTKISVSWSKIAEASSYTVQRYENGVASTEYSGLTTTNWADENTLYAGKAYTYKVRAIGTANDGTDISSDYEETSNSVTPAAPTVSITGTTVDTVVANMTQSSSIELINGTSDGFTIALTEESIDGVGSYSWYINKVSNDTLLGSYSKGTAVVNVTTASAGISLDKPGQQQSVILVLRDPNGDPIESATYHFTYVNQPVTGVELGSNPSKIKKGESVTLSAHVTPVDADVSGILWSSSDPSIATIDQHTGAVTVLTKGNVTFTAASESNGKYQASTTIEAVVPVTGVTLTSPRAWGIVNASQSYATNTSAATVYPADATVGTVSYKSSDDKIATVDQNGNVTALAAGTVTITATSEGINFDGNVETASYTFTSYEARLYDENSKDITRGEGSCLGWSGNHEFFVALYDGSTKHRPNESPFKYGVKWCFEDGSQQVKNIFGVPITLLANDRGEDYINANRGANADKPTVIATISDSGVEVVKVQFTLVN